MREAVQLGAEAVEVASVADVVMDSVGTARTRGTDKAMETKKGAIFMVASVGKKMNVSEIGVVLLFKQERSLGRTVLPIYPLVRPRTKLVYFARLYKRIHDNAY